MSFADHSINAMRNINMCSVSSLTFLLFAFFAIGMTMCLNADHDRTITVALSQQKPFVILDKNGSPTGLDVSIMENFAKKFNIHIDYIVVNSSLNYVLTNETNINSLFSQSILR